MTTVVQRREEALDVSATLDAVDRWWEVRTEAEAEMFVLAAHFADLHAGEGLMVGGPVLPGAERAVALGGAGTPVVAEFACVELGARMRMGSVAARHYLADVLDVRHRLPLLWGRVVARRARVPLVRLVAARTRHLSVEAAGVVDAAMVEVVDGSLPWGRFEARLEGRVVAADPEAAAAREETRAGEQVARRTRSSEAGMAGFYVRSTVGVIARFDATVAYVAERLAGFGDGDRLDVRRVKAVALLANPTRAVELLAAGAALRADTPATRDVQGELPPPPDDADGLDELEGSAGACSPDTADEPEVADGLDALGRMDAFARRVGFTPARVPAWLAPSPPDPTDPPDLPDPPDPPDPPPEGPGFVFDWSALLPPVELVVHVADESLRTGSGVVRWEGEGPVTVQYVQGLSAFLCKGLT